MALNSLTMCVAGSTYGMKTLPSCLQKLPTCPQCGLVIIGTNRYCRITNKRGLDFLDAKSAKAVWSNLQQAELKLIPLLAGSATLDDLITVDRAFERATRDVCLPPSMEVGTCYAGVLYAEAYLLKGCMRDQWRGSCICWRSQSNDYCRGDTSRLPEAA